VFVSLAEDARLTVAFEYTDGQRGIPSPAVRVLRGTSTGLCLHAREPSSSPRLQLPLKRFYRYSLLPSLTFDDTG
jgi:hypothetical protein